MSVQLSFNEQLVKAFYIKCTKYAYGRLSDLVIPPCKVGVFASLIIVWLPLMLTGQQVSYLNGQFEPERNRKKASFRVEATPSDSMYKVVIFRMDNSRLMEGSSLDAFAQKLEGLSFWYHPNGQVSAQGNYERGKKIGIWKRYDSQGNALTDKVYSGVSVDTFIFNSALHMPKPDEEYAPFEEWLRSSLITTFGTELDAYSPILLQFVVTPEGELQDIRIDDRISEVYRQWFYQKIMEVPSWKPGNNGSQNIHVRMDFSIETTP
jgi:hypothetical protein